MTFDMRDLEKRTKLTHNEIDEIIKNQAFVERCKNDGILTYERKCNELKERLEKARLEVVSFTDGKKKWDKKDVIILLEKIQEKKNE